MSESRRLQLVFVLLQVGDLVTTMLAISLGGYEANPLSARLMGLGTLQGLLFAKVIAFAVAVVIVWRSSFRMLRAANIFYSAVVAWNTLLIFFAARHVR